MNSNKVKEEFESHFIEPVSLIGLGSGQLSVTAKDELQLGCFLCPEGQHLQNLLIQHLQDHHETENKLDLLKCCYCAEGLRLQTELINHILEHLLIKLENEEEYFSEHDSLVTFPPCYQIENAERISSENPEFERHLNRIHDSSEETPKYQKRLNEGSDKKIQCLYCPKVFKYKQGCEKHFDLEHNPSNPFKCPKCGSRCRTLKNLHAHIRITHNPPRTDNVEPLTCHICKKSFPSQKQCALHLYTHREKFFSCDYCNMKFNNREQIKKHVLRHVGITTKKIKSEKVICDECSMLVFPQRMKRHKIIHHSNEKAFKCDAPDCSAAFTDSRSLKDHQNIHSGIKPYVCPFCGEGFRSGANLRLHRVRHVDPDRYHCAECQTSFVTKQALQKHQRRHTSDPDIRQFPCNICEKTFRLKDHVRQHIRRMHEEKDQIFQCEMCPKTYFRKEALGKHQRKNHNIIKRKSRVFPIGSNHPTYDQRMDTQQN